MKVLNFGSCNIDYVYSLDHIVTPGETESTYKCETFPGGKGLNQSIALAKAGAMVFHAGCVGKDGEKLLDIMKKSGVDTSYTKTVDEKNGHAVIQVSADGENSIFIYGGANEMVSEDFIDAVLGHFSEGDIILLQNEISNVDYIIRKAHQMKMRIVLNPSPYNEKIKSMDLNSLSYIILNEVELVNISGHSDPEESIIFFKKQYPNLGVMLTLGKKGCIYIDKTHELRQKAFKVDAVDTTAAGDTFTGYFVAGILAGKEYGEILKIASAAAAITVSKKGAAPSIPKMDEVVDKIESFKEHGVCNKYGLLYTQIEDYIIHNIKTANLKELSKHLGYSVVYTGLIVKKITNSTFTELLQKKRCNIAAQLLSETDISVESIVNYVGYENESFFRKVFVKMYGKKPLEFRKRTAGKYK